MDAGTTTNKDLDTGGYTAKTCEAYAAMTGATQVPSEERSSPASSGTWVYRDVRFVFNDCVLYFIGHKPDISIAGWVGFNNQLLAGIEQARQPAKKKKDP